MKCLIKNQVEIVRVVIVGVNSHSLKVHFSQNLVCLFFCICVSYSHYKDIELGWLFLYAIPLSGCNVFS